MKRAFFALIILAFVLFTGCGALFSTSDIPSPDAPVTLYYPQEGFSSDPGGYFPNGLPTDSSAISIFEPAVWPAHDELVSVLPIPDFGTLIAAEANVSKTVLWQIVMVDASVPEFLDYCERCMQCGIYGMFDELTGRFTAVTSECTYHITFDESNGQMSVIILKNG